jgi:hypothetical protein
VNDTRDGDPVKPDRENLGDSTRIAARRLDEDPIHLTPSCSGPLPQCNRSYT